MRVMSVKLQIYKMRKKDYEQFMRHCEVIQKMSDHSLLLKAKESEQLIVHKFISNSSSQLIPTLAQEKQLNHEHLESIIDYCETNQQSIAVFTQYTTHSLLEQLQARRNSNTRFSLEQLENILVSVVQALQYLEKKSIGHGCISMKDIVISHNGTVKLIDPCLASNSPLLLVQGYFYSPQLLAFNCMQNSCSGSSMASESIDFFKNDVFTLALLIIQMGLLHCNISNCIDYHQGKFDYGILQQFLNEFQCAVDYPPLINLLCGMLYEDPQARLDTSGVLNFLEQQFSMSDQDEEDSPSIISSSMSKSSRNDKTVRSFLLSQGPGFSHEASLKSSRESLLIENKPHMHNININNTVKRSSCTKIGKGGKLH